MIQALQILPEILTSNTDNINFSTIDLRSRSANCCGWLQYMEGGSDFTIIGGGLFEVTFNANVTSDTAGIVALALKSATGTDVEGTEMDDKYFIKDYLDSRYQRIDNIPRTVGNVAGKYPDNILLITMNGHITCSKYGVIYDSFDCRDRIAEYCWVVK